MMEIRFDHRKRSQAAITDAIILLLVATFSVSLIFDFVGNWGNDQDTVLRSAYVLNYMQSVVKTMYYVDASTLSNIDSNGITVYKYALAEGGFSGDSDTPPEYDLDVQCKKLEKYPGTLRVTDLLKRDLGDSDPGDEDPQRAILPLMDDKFGSRGSNPAEVPGRTAMRCAMKELMKPFAFSGYKYYFEVLLAAKTGSIDPVGDPQGALVSYVGPEITNSRNPRIVGLQHGDTLSEKRLENGSKPGCDAVRGEHYEVLTVSSPFQVLYTDTSDADAGLQSKFVKYKTRICIWKSNEDALSTQT